MVTTRLLCFSIEQKFGGRPKNLSWGQHFSFNLVFCLLFLLVKHSRAEPPIFIVVSVLDCSPFFPFSVFPKSMATTPPKRRLFETKIWPPKLKFDTWSLNTCPQRSSEPPSFSFALDLGHQSNFYLNTTSTFSKLTLQHAYIYIRYRYIEREKEKERDRYMYACIYIDIYIHTYIHTLAWLHVLRAGNSYLGLACILNHSCSKNYTYDLIALLTPPPI